MMNKLQLLSVGIKFLGVMLILSWLESTIIVVTLLVSGQGMLFSTFTSPYPALWPRVVLAILYVIAGYILVNHSDKLALKTLKSKSDSTKLIEKADLLFVLIAYQGLSSFVSAVIALVPRTLSLVLFPDPATQINGLYRTVSSGSNSVFFTSYLLQIAIGLTLFLKAQLITNWLWSKVVKKFWK